MLELEAYHVGYPPVKILPAMRIREWMEETDQRFANRCLPLLMANQSGFLLLNPVGFRATWNGGMAQSCLTLSSVEPGGTPPALSHFGSGILTWNLPYLFRTPPGYNVLARGPANMPKDGIAPLEGLVESDNEVVATFTMNWKFTRACTVTFAKDEPFCMLIPHARYDLEHWRVMCLPGQANPELYHNYQEWSRSRSQFNTALAQQDADACQQKWQKDYFQSAEQTKRKLACPMRKEEEDGKYELRERV